MKARYMDHIVDHGNILDDVKKGKPVVWMNPDLKSFEEVEATLPLSGPDVLDADRNWSRLAPLLSQLFPELAHCEGRIESDLVDVSSMLEALGLRADAGAILVKSDHSLPVAGSIKARGGIYEVCMHAWDLALRKGLLSATDDPILLTGEKCRAFFSSHGIAVGSTGNLGLSVGIAARALGFNAIVHMSSDAKKWKIDRLNNIGVDVVQHDADYGAAVDRARNVAELDPQTYFVDDERSELLFLGYSAAALHLKRQILDKGIVVDALHPLFIYLPCGIGGAPGGIAFGAKQVFGEHVHCFFVEPVQAPCALVQLMHGLDEPVSVYDFGLKNTTEADGMAVAQVSMFVARMMRNLVSGVITVQDDDLYRWLYLAKKHQNFQLEPSAASCFAGPICLNKSECGRKYVQDLGLDHGFENVSHVLWTTGGDLVPSESFEGFYMRGKELFQSPGN